MNQKHQDIICKNEIFIKLSMKQKDQEIISKKDTFTKLSLNKIYQN